MTTRLVLASLAVLATTSIADARRNPGPPRDEADLLVRNPHRYLPVTTCQPWNNKSLITIANVPRSARDAKDLQLGTLEVDTNGTWKFVERKHGSVTKQTHGCISPQELQEVTKAVKTATWKSTRDQFVCEAYAMSKTEYRIGGATKFTQFMCDGITPDRRTQASLLVFGRVLSPLGR